jgi:hypothetical protein
MDRITVIVKAHGAEKDDKRSIYKGVTLAKV